MDSSDEALVLACQRGDASAWQALVVRYQRLIYAICRHAGLDQHECADVFQSVFEALLQCLDHIERPALIGTWLATTARRQAWRAARSAPAISLPLGDDLPYADMLTDTAPLPDEILLRQEAQHRVRVAVAALDEPCRRLLELLFYRPTPAPYAEVAATLGIPEGSIGPTRARCLRKLRHLLDDQLL
jgi:RNA polymerase sigma factor (sigma-70 family)